MRPNTMRVGLTMLTLVAASCLRTPIEMNDGGSGGGSAGGTTAPTATLELSPATLTLPLGATAPLKVTSIQPDGTTSDVTQAAELKSEPEGVVTLSAGVLRAVAPGSAIIIAKVNQLEARASVSVPSAQVRTIALVVDEPTVAKGTIVPVTALATMNDGSSLDVTSTAMWTVDNPQDVPQVLEVVSPGRVLAKSGGRARVKATVGVVTGQAELEVRDTRVVSVMVTPSLASVPLNGSLSLTALARFQDGTTADVTASAEWMSSAPTFVVARPGVVVAKSAGSSSIAAVFEGQQGSATLTATEATPTQVVFMPSSITLGVRASAPLRLVATFSDGSTSDVTGQATFSSSQPAIAAVSTTGQRGIVSALSAGSADVTGRFGTLSAVAPVVVTAAAVQSIQLTPPSATIAGNALVNLRARAVYTDGAQADVSDQVLWSSEDSAIASVSNAPGARGQVRGLNGGTTGIVAQLGTIRARAEVTVQAATLSSIELAPSMVSVPAGRTTQLRVVAWFSDNSTRDVTQQAAWTSLSPMVATVSNQAGSKGQVRALLNGVASIQVTLQGQSATGTVNVEAPTVVQLSISPGTMTIPLGLPAGFEATAAYSDGTTMPVSDQVQWSSSNPSIADVTISQGYAILDSKQAGTAVITATMAGVPAARASVIITSATLNRIEVTPARPVLPVGAYVELTASGIYSDFTTQYLRYAASWTSSDPSVAIVGNTYQDKGFVQALRAGTTTITATYNGVSSSTVITVTSATLTQIQVTPFAPQLPVGFDTYLRATGLYSDNTTRDLTYIASWTSNATSVASIGTYAYLQPLQPGTATITATYTGVQGSTALTVTTATLSAITISSPSSTPLSVQGTRRLSAQGTFSDGQMMDVTPYVTWLSSAAGVAAVSNAYPTNGEVKGLAAGSANVTAIRGSVSAMTSVTVQ